MRATFHQSKVFVNLANLMNISINSTGFVMTTNFNVSTFVYNMREPIFNLFY